MNKNQIKFTCDQLDFNEVKTAATIDVMVHEKSAYAAEITHGITKGTLMRDCNRIKKKWRDLREVSKQINNLDYDYEPPVLQEDIDRATKSLHEAIEQIDGYKEDDFNCIEALKATVLEEVTNAFNSEFKTK